MADTTASVMIIGDSSGAQTAAQAAADALRSASEQMKSGLEAVKQSAADAYSRMGIAANEASAEMVAASERVKVATGALAQAQIDAKASADGLRLSYMAGKISQAEYNEGVLRTKGALQTVEAEYRNARRELEQFHQAQAGVTVSSGQMRFAMRDLGYQISDIGTMFAMGASPMMVFAMQGNQVVTALGAMQTEARGVIGFLSGVWGQTIMAAVSVLGIMVSKMMDTKEALQEVQVSSDALSSVQSTLSGVFDMTTGKMRDQTDAAIALAKATIVLAQAQSEQKLAEARRTVSDSAKDQWSLSGGLGGGVSLGRERPITAQVESQFRNGIINSSQAIDTLKRMRDAGRITTETFTQLSAAYASVAAETANQSVFDKALGSIGSKSLAPSLVKPKGNSRSSAAEERREERETTQAILAEYNLRMEAAKGDMAERLRIANEEASYLKRKYGEQSAEYMNAQAEIVRIKREADQQIRQIEVQKGKAEEAARLESVADEESAARAKLQARQITADEMLALDRKFEQQKFDIRRASLARERALVDPARDPVRYAQLNIQMEALERQHQLRLTQIDRQGVMQRLQAHNQAAQGVARSWAQQLAQMATLQQGFMTTVRGLWQGLANVVGDVIQQMLEKWIVAQLIKIGLMKVEGASSVATEVGKAGAGGVASMAAAPFPLNLTAPAFGASMAAAAAAYGSIASAEGGDWQVRAGLYQLHTDEMVLPAWAATPLRSMIAGAPGSGGGGLGMPGGGAGGDVHHHTWNIQAWDSRDAKRAFMDNNGAIAKALRKHVRDGGRG